MTQMQQRTFTLKNPAGQKIFVYQWVGEPENKPKATIQIAHGMMEHAGRYAEFAKRLVKAGFIVYANDHHGHGKSVTSTNQLGHFNGKKGLHQVINDMKHLSNHIKTEYPDLPLILIGHSMGSLLARFFVMSNEIELGGLILSGTNYTSSFLSDFGKSLANLSTLLYGSHYKNKLINHLAYGNYSRSFSPKRTNFDWLSRDTKKVDAYVNDRLCGYRSTSGFYEGLFYGMREINKPENIKNTKLDLPVLIFSGKADPVGNFGKGVQKVFNQYKKAGLKNLTIKLYKNGRHEMLNEVNREDVYEDVVKWIEESVLKVETSEKAEKTAAKIFDKYYPPGSEARRYLYPHSLKVMEAAIKIAEHNQHLNPDIHQIVQMALLHDIGIFMTNAPDIGCYGDYPYIAHGYLGRELLEKNGLNNIAPVCERHIGVGISLKDILENDLPLPHREMLPLTIEEKIICYADKFYSKSPKHLLKPKPVEKIKKKLLKYGKDKAELFEEFVEMFGVDYLF